MIYVRELAEGFLSLAKSYYVVTLVGPRQSGKTTLAREVFQDKAYVNLESIDIQELAKKDPVGFLNKYPNGAIFDEIQRVPELLSYIQVIVDERQVMGLFILTASHQFELYQAITQSLAGRTALLTLLPLSLLELQKSKIEKSIDEYLLCGGYPRVFKDQLDPTKVYRNYFQTYVERDLRQLLNIRDLTQFQRFIRVCAGRIGQIIMNDHIAGEIGISSATVKAWLSILEASFIIFRLQPYYENFGKRIIKSSKLYFTDVGLACYLLSLQDVNQINRDPLRGHLFENLVILELMKSRLNKGLDPNLYYFRDSHGNEVDVIYKTGSSLIPIEIKSSSTFSASFLKSLNFFKELVQERCSHGYLVYAGEVEQNIDSFELVNYKKSGSTLEKLF